MFKTARYFAYNKHKLRFYCHKIFISFTCHERTFSNHGFYNDTTVHDLKQGILVRSSNKFKLGIIEYNLKLLQMQ